MEPGNQYVSSVTTPQGWWLHSCVADKINICHSHKGYWTRIELVAWASYQIGNRAGRECRERFSRHRLQKKTASLRSWHASRHVRNARAVIHVGMFNPQWRGKRFWLSQHMRNLNYTYLVRGPWRVPHIWSISTQFSVPRAIRYRLNKVLNSSTEI